MDRITKNWQSLKLQTTKCMREVGQTAQIKQCCYIGTAGTANKYTVT